MHKLGRRGTIGSLLDPEPDLAPNAMRASFEEPPGEQAENRPARTLTWPSYPLLAVLMFALGGLSYGVFLMWRAWEAPASVSNGAVLGLRADQRGKELRISWNREAAVVNQARGAVLSIRDGDSEPHDLSLDQEQLHNGSVVCVPTANSVQLRLEVTGQGGTKTSETILIILAGAVPKAQTAPPVAANRPAAASSARNRRLSPGRAALVDPPAPPASVPPQAFTQIEQIVFAQPKLATPPPPESQQSGINPREPQQLPVAPVFVGPRPIHESVPDLTSEISATVISEVEVQVKVQVDESGRVVRVDFVRSTGPASDALVNATRQAAMLWRFAPAVRGNQPVTSEVILMFRYIPETGGN